MTGIVEGRTLRLIPAVRVVLLVVVGPLLLVLVLAPAGRATAAAAAPAAGRASINSLQGT